MIPLKVCERFIEGMDFDEFVSDEKTTFAVRHTLEIIGEAVKHIPDEIGKEHPSVPWRKITGTRDVMIHAYFGVDLNVVWKTANERLPELKKDIEKILKEKDFE
ncbi:HepT-like ribonuclease domain-containing protein [Methanosarcina sp. T3]|uniref:HepT-like ribonuclease domain-containing protein n=1 Tax=Methanosarcina sp. T3 TaxID=3439062 RepID=UPI003F87D167